MSQDILIIPKSLSSPEIQFSGSAAANIKLVVAASGSVIYTGSNGPLFSISDSLTTTVGIGTTSPRSMFDVSGSVIFGVNENDSHTIIGTINFASGSRFQVNGSTPTGYPLYPSLLILCSLTITQPTCVDGSGDLNAANSA